MEKSIIVKRAEEFCENRDMFVTFIKEMKSDRKPEEVLLKALAYAKFPVSEGLLCQRKFLDWAKEMKDYIVFFMNNVASKEEDNAETAEKDFCKLMKFCRENVDYGDNFYLSYIITREFCVTTMKYLIIRFLENKEMFDK